MWVSINIVLVYNVSLRVLVGLIQPVFAYLTNRSGCVIAVPTKAEQLELGLNPEEAKQNKLAILRVPLKFPTVSRGRR